MQTAQEVINTLGAISKARFLAMDEDGDWFCYILKPHSENCLADDVWEPNEKEPTSFLKLNAFFNIQPAENWKESLVEYQPKI